MQYPAEQEQAAFEKEDNRFIRIAVIILVFLYPLLIVGGVVLAIFLLSNEIGTTGSVLAR